MKEIQLCTAWYVNGTFAASASAVPPELLRESMLMVDLLYVVSHAVEVFCLSMSVTAAITLAKKDAAGEETMVDFLEEGEFADLMAGSYFYLTSK